MQAKVWWREYAETHEPKKILRERPTPNSPDGDPYLIRWELADLGGSSVYIHRIVRPDNSPDFHDHPWAFWHLILEGSYREEWVDRNDDRPIIASAVRVPGDCARRDTEYAHRIADLLTQDVWTLVMVGPKDPELVETSWGFIDRETGCWTPWRSYVDGERCA